MLTGAQLPARKLILAARNRCRSPAAGPKQQCTLAEGPGVSACHCCTYTGTTICTIIHSSCTNAFLQAQTCTTPQNPKRQSHTSGAAVSHKYQDTAAALREPCNTTTSLWCFFCFCFFCGSCCTPFKCSKLPAAGATALQG